MNRVWRKKEKYSSRVSQQKLPNLFPMAAWVNGEGTLSRLSSPRKIMLVASFDHANVHANEWVVGASKSEHGRILFFRQSVCSFREEKWTVLFVSFAHFVVVDLTIVHDPCSNPSARIHRRQRLGPMAREETMSF